MFIIRQKRDGPVEIPVKTDQKYILFANKIKKLAADFKFGEILEFIHPKGS